jgi:hypothetical protein
MLTFDDLAGGAASLDPLGAMLGSGAFGVGGGGDCPPFPPGGDDCPPFPLDGGGTPGTGVSALRMIGSPSFPEPMMIIFVFCDCASKSVASMPRQRK